jgi:RND family efflux transporter MFP subunit
LLLVALMSCSAASIAAEFDCVLEPRQIVDIRSPATGLIERITVDRGQSVRAGQVLVSLDTGQDRAALDLARQRATMEGAIRSGESRLDFANAKLKRREHLVSEKFVSAQDVEETKAERSLAEAELLDARDNRRLAELEVRRAEQNIRIRTLSSPINGVVVERNMHPGELADTADGRKPILRIADMSVLHAEAILPAEAYAAVKPGQKVTIRASVPVKLSTQGVVKVVDKMLDVASGTFGVRLEVANPGFEIPAGIHCKAEFSQVQLAAPAARRPPAQAKTLP